MAGHGGAHRRWDRRGEGGRDWGPRGGGVLEALGAVDGARPARVLLCT
jgi:hypothetical protein